MSYASRSRGVARISHLSYAMGVLTLVFVATRAAALRVFVLPPIAADMTAGCWPESRSADYREALKVCRDQSHTWDEYTPCCVDVARQEHRNPELCFRDGGVR